MATTIESYSMDIKPKYRNPYFDFMILNDDQELLYSSFALRYRVYCEELQFLPKENYPDQKETDEFDLHSVHIGVVTRCDREVIGTARIVKPSTLGLPMDRHCVYDKEFFLDQEGVYPEEILYRPSTVEISRLLVSARYRRRANDSLYALDGGSESSTERRYNKRPVIPLGIYKTLYQFSKRNDITHWVAIMEEFLLKQLTRWQMVFKPIGPTAYYSGSVTPCILEVADIERQMSRNLPELMDEWLDGLEPEYTPRSYRLN